MLLPSDLPLISVIIPLYNAETYILRAVRSVLAQTYTHFELIIVDDGSSDRSVALLEGLPYRLYQQENRGASAARNLGLAKACGEFIAFLDADDIWHPEKLASQLKAFSLHPDWVACYTACCDSEQQIAVPLTEQEPSYTSRNLIDLFVDPYLTTSSFMLQRRLLEHVVGFDESLETAEDLDFYLRCVSQGVIGGVEQALVYKTAVEGSLGGLLSSYQDNLDVMERTAQRYPQQLLPLLNASQARIYLAWGRDLLWRGQVQQALPVIRQSLSQHFTIKALSLLIKAYLKRLVFSS